MARGSNAAGNETQHGALYPRTHSIGSRVGPRAGLDTVEKKNSQPFSGTQTPDLPACSPIQNKSIAKSRAMTYRCGREVWSLERGPIQSQST